MRANLQHLSFAVLVALTIPAFAAKEIDRTWMTGKVLDSQSAKTFVQTGSSTQSNGTASTFGSTSSTTVGNISSGTYSGTTVAHGTSETQIHNVTIQDTQLLIVTDEFLHVVNDSIQKSASLYGVVGRAIANRKHGGHVIVGDPVQYSQEKSTMFLKDVDGKVCKLEIASSPWCN